MMSQENKTLFVLPGNRKVYVSMNPDDWPRVGGYGFVPREALVPDPKQSRKTFDVFELSELEEGMSSRGQEEVITVRLLTKNEKKELPKDSIAHYQIVSGERRWRVSSSDCADIPVLEIRVREYKSRVDQRISGLSINLNRANIPPMEIARELALILDDFGQISEAAFAREIGMAQVKVNNLLSLMKLSLGIQKLVDDKEVPVIVAYALARVATDEQERLLDEAQRSGKNAVTQANWIKMEAQSRGVSISKARHQIREPRKNRSIAINAFATTAEKARMLDMPEEEMLKMFKGISNEEIDDFFIQMEESDIVWCRLMDSLRIAAEKAKHTRVTTADQIIAVLGGEFIKIDYWEVIKLHDGPICLFEKGRAVSARRYRTLWNAGNLCFQRDRNGKKLSKENHEKPYDYPTPDEFDAQVEEIRGA